MRGGQKFIFVPYTGQTNDAGMLAWNREADYDQVTTWIDERSAHGAA